jgi:hypothetical protein
MNNDIRWKQRFQNFEKAYLLFDEAMQMDSEKLSQLEKEGIIQRFEVVIELAWKTLKDYLENKVRLWGWQVIIKVAQCFALALIQF